MYWEQYDLQQEMIHYKKYLILIAVRNSLRNAVSENYWE
jgi:hypothetical protein